MSEASCSSRRFELGLAMAGAASAGAYTAGVVDFLIEALAEWEAAKRQGDPSVPDHEVVIRVAAGTSAGGIVAALLAMLPFTGHFPIRCLADASKAADAENARRNLLYRSWVLETDVHRLLTNDDICKQPPHVPSLLNGSVLADIANAAIADVRTALATSPPELPSYFANPLQVYLSLTNIRGVPYVIRMVADEDRRGHMVTSHSDYAHFAVVGSGPEVVRAVPRGAIPVNLPGTIGLPAADGWDSLRDAALATSAFPCGFPARRFRNPISVYQARDRVGEAASAGSGTALAVQIDLPETDAEAYDFWCVDGGLLYNEPLEHARRVLARSDRPSTTDGRSSNHALLLIDPFPNDSCGKSAGPENAPDVLGGLMSLIPVLRAQAAFRPEELIQALDENVRTRYLISPKRETMLSCQGELASAGLSGFAGFMHEQLRMHDFQLGRRNCQKFLADHFHLHIDSPIVAPSAERLARMNALEAYHPTGIDRWGSPVKRRDLMALIPLMPSVRAEVPLRPWPKLNRKLDLNPVRTLIERRADLVVPELVRTLLMRAGIGDRRLINRMLGAIAADMITRRVGRAVADAMEGDLLKRGLL